MLLIRTPTIKEPDEPLLSRMQNFLDLRQLFLSSEMNLAKEIQIIGSDYVRIELQPELGSGVIDFIEFDPDFLAVIGDIKFNDYVSLRYLGEDWIRFAFKLEGGHSMMFDGTHEANLDGRIAHCFTHPSGVYHTDLYAPMERTRWVSILCKSERLLNMLGVEEDHLPKHLSEFLYNQEPPPFVDKRPLSYAMQKLVTDLMRPPELVSLKPIYLKAKCYEALYTYLEKLMSDDGDNGAHPTLSKRDIDSLEEARMILETSGSETPNMKMLSRQVGLNRNKLSYGFREHFGLTIFDFCKELRLAKAHELLQSSEYSVSQIADKLGYSHASSFSAAFKARYGYSPKLARTTIKR